MPPSRRNLEEFVSEAQEIVEEFSRSLETLDQQLRAGEVDPDVLNTAFRAVHSLKGMAGIFGAEGISRTAHGLESALDKLRLGRARLDAGVLDHLFAAVDAFGGQLAAFLEGRADAPAPAGLLEALAAIGEEKEEVSSPSPPVAGLDPSVLGVLTEYEEHRLRENVRLGRRIFRVHALFDLASLDVGIESLKEELKAFGEVITYLPSMDETAPDKIALDVLVGTKCTVDELAAGVAREGVTVHDLGTGAQAAGTPREAAGMGERRPASPEGPPVPAESAEEPPEGGTAEDVPAVVREAASAAEPATQMEDVVVRGLAQTVRVDLHRLDTLMNLVGELGLVQASLTDLHAEHREDLPADLSRDLALQLRTMERKLELLRQAILVIRMVPVSNIFDKLKRVVRRIARETEKDVRLVVTGGETELDKLIAEEISAPLVHMIRNAIDHGIESTKERVAAGKPAVGTISLRAAAKGSRVVIEVEDDGRGMDPRSILERAVARGVVSPEEAENYGPQEALELIFVPGFSTRDGATSISGRGVGMDVVKTNITRLSGMIDVRTQVGRGTCFSITLPVSLAIIQALVVEAAGETYCIPLNAVLEAVLISQRDIATVEGQAVLVGRDRTLPLVHLSKLFDLPGAELGYADPEQIHVVVVGLAQHRVGLVVDQLRGQHDVVVKPLGSALRGVPGVAGATELGANRTVLLLDVAGLVQRATRSGPAPGRIWMEPNREVQDAEA